MDRFLIAPFETGLELDKKPWQIPDEAFSQFKNAYVFRGRVKKRFGTELSGKGATTAQMQNMYSKLAINLGNTDGVGFISNVLNPIPINKWKVGQQFSIGTVIFTVATAGAGIQMLRTDGSAEVATFDTATGAYSITIAALINTPVFFYPSEPVMGLTQYEKGTINDQVAYAFDTQLVYKYAGGRWVNDGPLAPAYFHGSDQDFFWSACAGGLLPQDTVMYCSNFHVVNYNGLVNAADDPIWYYNGAVWASNTGAVTWKFKTTNEAIFTAKLIIPFKNRLVLLNTVERDAAGANNIHYPNRCRFSHNGNPLAAGAWLESNQVGFTGGGFIDPATEEEIVSAEFIKDRLIVYFERSTWELAYTGNQVEPFTWQKLNTELGCESTFSTVPFDKVVLTICINGISACNGANVDRIDTKIPDYVFNFANEYEGIVRVHGIRDYKTEMVYWTYPAHNKDRVNAYPANASAYPNTVLVYNYRNNSWAENDDCITCWGYFEQTDDKTWADLTMPWEEANFTWDSYLVQSNERVVLAGNQQGYVTIVNPALTSNARSMSITDIDYDAITQVITLTIIDHTLFAGDFIKLYNLSNIVIDGGPGLGSQIYKVQRIVDKDNIEIIVTDCVGVYRGGGSVSRVSKIDIKTKQWNFYLKSGRTSMIPRIDFHVSKTPNGYITIDYATNSSGLDLRSEGQNTGTALGTNVLPTFAYPTNALELLQERLWHSVYFQAEGEFIQLHMYLTDAQMTTASSAFADFDLHGIIIHAQPTRMSIGGY